MSSALVDGARLSIGTLTAIPVSPPSRVDRDRGRIAMLLAPLAVLPLAVLVGATLAAGTASGLPPAVIGAAAVGLLALGNRAMHLDGLADTVDGLAAPYDAERRRAIMKSGDVGPAGASALALVLLVQAVCLGVVAELPFGWLLGAILVCASRSATSVACHRSVPPATQTGLGAAVAATVPTTGTVVSWVLTAAVLGGTFALAGRPWWQALVACAVALVALALLLARVCARIGGLTGDVCGASIEVCLTALLVVAVAG